MLIILLDKPIVSLFCGKTAVSFDLSQNITGVGKVDIFNNKTGVWVYFDNKGKAFIKGNYTDNLKCGEWIVHGYNDEIQISNFRGDTLWGTSKIIRDNNELTDIIFHDCGKRLYQEMDHNYIGTTLDDINSNAECIDWISRAHQEDHEMEYNLARRVIKEEFNIMNDDSYSHKENKNDTLSPILSKYGFIFDVNAWIAEDYYHHNDDRFVTITPFEQYINIFNYILIIVLIVSNIVTISHKK
ncbi:MAG: hypothetical protein J6T70_03125 [Bacteroidales bacterium]|nr:hypothetical protein [Bacteroidales bacterium]